MHRGIARGMAALMAIRCKAANADHIRDQLGVIMGTNGGAAGVVAALMATQSKAVAANPIEAHTSDC